MPAAARIGDLITCGDTLAVGSPNVTINGLPACRIGDITAGHVTGTTFYPPINLILGSGTVTINGIPASRVGDKINKHTITQHDGAVAVGSPDVTIGG